MKIQIEVDLNIDDTWIVTRYGTPDHGDWYFCTVSSEPHQYIDGVRIFPEKNVFILRRIAPPNCKTFWWFIDLHTNSVKKGQCTNSETHRDVRQSGNYFLTEEAAHEALRRITRCVTAVHNKENTKEL